MRGKEASVPPREAGGASPETRTSKEVRNQTSPCDNCLQWRVHTTAAHAPTLRSNHRDSAARAARCEIVLYWLLLESKQARTRRMENKNAKVVRTAMTL